MVEPLFSCRRFLKDLGQGECLQHLLGTGLVNPELADDQLVEHDAHSVDVVGVGVRTERDVNSVGVVVRPQVVDERFAVVCESAVDDAHELVRAGSG